MPSIPRDIPEQEQSIKARGSELYAKLERDRPDVKPFEVYLRETPAAPISLGVLTGLWAAGIIVAVLFAAALWRISHRGPRGPRQLQRAPAKRAASKAASTERTRSASFADQRGLGPSKTETWSESWS